MLSGRFLHLYLALIVCVPLLALGIEAATRATPADEAARGIAKLHQQDIEATLAHDPVELADLFTDDAVLLEPGAEPLIGKSAILAANQKDKAAHPQMKVISYKPDIKDLQIEQGIAFEWDYFDATFSDSGKGNDVQTFRGKALRVLRRQPDGSWKFVRVMWNMAEGQSAPK